MDRKQSIKIGHKGRKKKKKRKSGQVEWKNKASKQRKCSCKIRIAYCKVYTVLHICETLINDFVATLFCGH